MEYHAINKNRIIEAFIVPPHKSEDVWDMSASHGWQVALTVGYDQQYPIRIVIDRDSEQECKWIIDELDFIKITQTRKNEQSNT